MEEILSAGSILASSFPSRRHAHKHEFFMDNIADRAAFGQNRFRAAFLLLLLLAIFAANFIYGLSDGLHKRMYYPGGRWIEGIGIALSEQVYGLDKGYLAYSDVMESVYEIRTKYAAVKHRYGSLTVDELKDSETINKVIENAASLEIKDRDKLDYLMSNEKGIADFFKLSFSLFGYNIEGFYYTYFIILLSSVVMILLGFPNRPIMYAWVGIYLCSHFFSMLQSASDLAVLTPHNTRIMAILSLLPASHVCAAIFYRIKPGFRSTGLLLAQVFLLSFLVFVRDSVMWQMVVALGLGLLMLAYQAGTLFREKARSEDLKTRLSPAWVVVALLVGILGVNAYKSHALNTKYQEFAGDGHLFWHTIGTRLIWLPGFQEKYPAFKDYRKDIGHGDHRPELFVQWYLEQTGQSTSNLFITENQPEPRHNKVLYEQVLKGVILNYFRESPRGLVEHMTSNWNWGISTALNRANFQNATYFHVFMGIYILLAGCFIWLVPWPG